jgi:hypothetical protein
MLKAKLPFEPRNETKIMGIVTRIVAKKSQKLNQMILRRLFHIGRILYKAKISAMHFGKGASEALSLLAIDKRARIFYFLRRDCLCKITDDCVVFIYFSALG